MNNYSVRLADYDNESDAKAIVSLMREYALIENCDRDALNDLPRRLREINNGFTILAWSSFEEHEPVGLINCFFGYSTFQLRPLVNIHDVIVTEFHRGKGVAGQMLAGVESESRNANACRITLEVLGDNTPAITAYEKYGFGKDPSHPKVDTYFMRKTLVD